MFWKEAFVSDSLVELLALTYTEEEARIVDVVGFIGVPAWVVALRVKRPLGEVSAILKSLDERILIFSFELKGIRFYSFLQMVPGVFEAQMIRSKNSSDGFYKEFARLYHEAVFMDRRLQPSEVAHLNKILRKI